MRKTPEYVSNGQLNVPNISIEYRGYTIRPKLDFGAYPVQAKGNIIRRGYIVVKDGYLALPGGAWLDSVIEAKVCIDLFIKAKGDSDKFWTLLKSYQGLDEYTDV